MSSHKGSKGRNPKSNPRKRPPTAEISRYNEDQRKTACLRPIVGNILPPNGGGQ